MTFAICSLFAPCVEGVREPNRIAPWAQKFIVAHPFPLDGVLWTEKISEWNSMEQRFTDPGTWMYMEELQAPATTKHQRLVLPNNAQQAHSRNMQKHAKTLNLCKGLQRFNMFQPCKDENVEYIKISTYFNKAFPASTPQHLSLGCCGAGLSHTSKNTAVWRAHRSIEKIL